MSSTSESPTSNTGISNAGAGFSDSCNKSGNSSNMMKRPTFSELLAIYKKKGAAGKKGRSCSSAASTSPHAGNVRSSSIINSSTAACYPVRLTTPWSWPYLYCFPPPAHANMLVHPNLQYPVIYPHHGVSTRPINENLAKGVSTVPNMREDNERGSEDLWPRWCPLGLFHTQKKRLQNSQ